MTTNELIVISTKDYSLVQNYSEIKGLVDFLRSKNIHNFAEIGTHKGGTYFLFSQIATGKKISIDLCDGNLGGIGWYNSKLRNNHLTTDNSYFIEGNSKEFETVKQLKDILNGEQLDFLFIDGDHTYEGVKQDYYIYKEFVKQGGFIALHDINSTTYHEELNCHVSQLWKEIKANKIKYKQDEYFINEFNINNHFGGIGIIENKYDASISIFQPYFNQESKNKLDYSLIPLINTTKNDYFENSVLVDLCHSDKLTSDYIGLCSWRLNEKLKINGEQLKDFFYQNTDKDVLIFSPDYSYMYPQHKIDIWELNEGNKTPIYYIANYIDNLNILKDKIIVPWTYCFCNYFITKKDILHEYVNNFLIPILQILEDPKHENKLKDLKFIHRDKICSAKTFFLEGLFGSFLSNRKYSKVDLLKYEFTKYKEPDITKQSINKIVNIKGLL